MLFLFMILSQMMQEKRFSQKYLRYAKYLTHIQHSVFEGNISTPKITALKNELKQFIRKDVDSVILFSSRDERWLKKEFIGLNDDKTSRFI